MFIFVLLLFNSALPTSECGSLGGGRSYRQTRRSSNCWDQNKLDHQMKRMSPRMMENLLYLDCINNNFKELLGPLNQPRVVGSEGSRQAREHIVQTLELLGWFVELQEFTQNTVIGEQTFINIIATRNINSPRRLVVSAHYDSKINPEGFIGAIDSAAPCAMLLKLAQTLDKFLDKKGTPELTLQLVFFDGEEAFKSWTATDSLYGSRYMADTWAQTPYSVKKGLGFCQSRTGLTELDRIDSFVLLDLIGAPKPVFRKYTKYDTTLYDDMVSIETKMNMVNESCLFRRVLDGTSSGYIVGDDHQPFYDKGIRRILHLISTPFPSVWHTSEDTAENLDYPSINYIQRLVTIFVAEYLHL